MNDDKHARITLSVEGTRAIATLDEGIRGVEDSAKRAAKNANDLATSLSGADRADRKLFEDRVKRGSRQEHAERRKWIAAYDAARATFEGLADLSSAFFSDERERLERSAETWRRTELEKIDASERASFAHARTARQRANIEREFEERRAEIEAAAEAKRMEIERKRFDQRKRQTLADLAIDMAQAIGKTYAEFGPLGAIVQGVVVAAITAQMANVAAQEFPGYRLGGYTGDAREDAAVGVVHGREFVVNAERTREYRPLLERINAGSASRETGVGGGLASARLSSAANDAVVTELRELKREIASVADRPIQGDLFVNGRGAGKIVGAGAGQIKRSRAF
ncbi:MAG: hypothetical protein GF419_14485 [Ignavibacteriales bacterium]|nr:hypothetical protein [Ignavibacteriales bacterium]